MVLNANGNVGIGVPDPKGKLHVNGSTFIYDDSSGSSLNLYITNPQYKAGLGTRNITNVGQALDFYSGSTAENYDVLTNKLMTIVSTGNVGIGTDNPATRLHVAGNAVIGSGTTSNGQITYDYITGGYGNAADNFHIDNNTNAGTMLINYTNERPVKLFNSGTTGSFLVYSNNIDPIFVSRNDFPTTGWISRID